MSTQPDPERTTRVCVVGLGNLGGTVAAHLADVGYPTTGYDPDPGARARAEEAGVVTGDTVAGAVAKADVVITSLPDGVAVRAVWLGPGGLVESTRPGIYLVELSTIGPDTMLEVAGPAAAAGLKVIDAPVSGGPPEAVTGDLVVIVGGEQADIAAVRPVLADVGATVHVAGPVGSAKTVKLVNNMITNATVLVSAEAFQVGVAAGIEPRRLFDLLSQMGGGRSHHFQKRFPWALDGDFHARFSIKLAEKDFRLGLELGDWAGVPTPAAATMRSLYSVAMAEGMADDDIVGLMRLYERWAGPRSAPRTVPEGEGE